MIVATYGTKEILGVHAESGQIMWRYPYPAAISIGLVSTPVAVGSRLFVCAGEGRQGFFGVSPDAGRKRQDHLPRGLPEHRTQANMFNTVAIHEDAVFGFGGNRTAGFLHCTDAHRPPALKQAGREWTNQQNLVIADGLILP